MRDGAQSAEAFAAGRDRIANESTEAAAAMTDNGGRLLQPAAGDPARNQIRRPSPLGLGAAGNRSGQAQAAPDDFPLPFVLTGKDAQRSEPLDTIPARRPKHRDRSPRQTRLSAARPPRPRNHKHLLAPVTRSSRQLPRKRPSR